MYQLLPSCCSGDGCEKVFENGLTLNTSKEYLWLTNEFKIDDGGALPVRPLRIASDDVDDGVMFAFTGMKFLALRKFYYLEVGSVCVWVCVCLFVYVVCVIIKVFSALVLHFCGCLSFERVLEKLQVNGRLYPYFNCPELS